MSLHIESSEEARVELKKLRRQNIISAWVVTVLMFVLLTLLFLLTKIYIMDKVETDVVAINMPYAPMSEPTPEEMPTSSPATQTPNVSIVTAAAPNAEVVVPQIDMPDTPVSDSLPTLSVDLGDVSMNNFGNLGTEGSGFGGGSPGGSTLEGTFYDTKLNRSGTKPTNLPESEFLDIVNSFITHGWNESAFSKFYRSPHKLYISHFYISKCNADDAPKAFKCDERVKGSRWVAVYKGKVEAPISGKFRFVGYGDDALVVRFNNENVLDYGWYQIGVKSNTASVEWQKSMQGIGDKDKTRKFKAAGINEFPMKFYKYSSTPHWNQTIGGMGGGKVFSVEAGKVYPIEILISEIPGGAFGMALLMEEVDEKSPQVDPKTKTPILNLFRTNFGDPGDETKKDNAVPFLSDSYIWRAVHD